MRAPFVLLAASTLALAGCGRGASGGGPAPEADGGPPREVRCAQVAQVTWPRDLRLTGTLEATDASTIRAEVAGRLLALEVDLGQQVAQGAVLAQVDPEPLRLEVTRAAAALSEARARLGLAPAASDDGQPKGPDGLDPSEAPGVRLARAVLAEARARHERVLRLLRDGVATPADRDTAEASLKVAEERLAEAIDGFEVDRASLALRRAELALAEDRLARATLRAPFAGVVAARLSSPGERVETGAAVVRLARIDPLRLVADVPELSAGPLRPGLELTATVDGWSADDPARVVRAALARVAPEIDATARTRRIEADVPNADLALPAGAFLRIVLVTDPAATTLAAPAAAIRSFAGLDKVLVVDAAGKAHEQLVTLGRRDGERVEVLAGVEAGARVVLDPGGLRDGAVVRVAE